MEELIRQTVDPLRNGVTLSTQTWLMLLLATAVGSFAGAYLRGKASHLATKEDIGEITEKVQEVETAFRKLIAAVVFSGRAKSGSILLEREARSR